MVWKYIRTDFEPRKCQSQAEPYKDLHVLLTGSTGSLGTHLLECLICDHRVSKVTCLDRSANADERWKQSVSTWLKSDHPVLNPAQVVFYQADYGRADFGLPVNAISDLRDTVNIIIHNAWKVDFNHSLASFETVHIQGVRNFIDFSASSRLAPRIVFVSSISSVGAWHTTLEPQRQSSGENKVVIPEEFPPTAKVSQPIGYAESKAVSEQILAVAAKSSGPKASIVRVGQIAGPIGKSSGAIWNQNEWFPLLLKTSKALGMIPQGSLLNIIDWIPVDVLATVMVELAIPRHRPGLQIPQEKEALQVYNLVNPSRTTWNELLPAVRPYIGDPEIVTMQEWVSELEKVNKDDPNVIVSLPAVKILDFFQGHGEVKLHRIQGH